jgi:outer membrane protein
MTKRIAAIVLIALVINAVLLDVLFFNKRDRVAFVDIGKLHEGYKLKAELEQKAKGRIYSIKNVLDSMTLVRKLQPNGMGYTTLDTNIARFQYELNRAYADMNKDISEKVWERLNPLLEKYGQAHSYSIIIGANGAGTVLYGSDKADITKDVIEYANKNYESGK